MRSSGAILWLDDDENRAGFLLNMQLAPNGNLAAGINHMNLWKTDLAMSKPIVVIVCMAHSSESWEP
jgi:hypothetical protein